MFHLSNIEKMAFQGLSLRERLIRKEYVEPLEADLQSFFRGVEQRLALPEGSLGVTYTLDTQTWTVQEVEVPTPETEEIPNVEQDDNSNPSS